ncbi:MAG: hypothetical protein J1G38_02410 [Clostridiales bacterium]|nr:hypothetical protein [Clostridiales bacterium]
MSKIIPILSIIFAVLGVSVAAVGLTAVAVGAKTGSAGIIAVAVPFAIVGAVMTGMSAALAFFFRRDRLCFIAFFINIGGVVLSIISIIIWLAAM